ncbi:AraC family transcriptional regulator ligand-binding domain-containing protein [Microvirga sp. BT689]|uniref:AraC family transcriptional regulator n=1 Tax=Microvirga arvi TaxID=2778731 RepID=UPI00194FA05A|nr:AraC family transcriptional regulator [Microvirga arvi]MBM6584338.1 AraC family transcriptional regulator ligand-binding domain-containing protein [Microvirga arvi]
MGQIKLSRLAGRRPIELPSDTSLLSKLTLDYADARGMRVSELLKKAGMHAIASEGEHRRMSRRSQIALANLVAEESADGLFGFHLAQDFDLRKIGALYYLIVSSDTLAEAVDYAVNYSTVLDEQFLLQRLPGPLTLGIGNVGMEPRSNRHQTEFWMTCLLRLMRTFTGRDITPNYVSFIHVGENNTSEIERYFGCSIRFGEVKHEVAFDHQVLGLLNSVIISGADPFLNRILLDHLDSVTEHLQFSRTSAQSYVEHAIASRLPNGDATISNVAAELGMSVRTLARRLAEEGLTFSRVLEKIRLDLAQRYLRNEKLSVSQVAWLLGYSEVSSFIHAFHRWTGKSPTSARRDMISNEEQTIGEM